LLTLEPPFKGQSREQVLAQIVQKEPRPPRRVNRKVPIDLETICLKCLEKDPDRRYQTAGQLAEDLRRYVNRFAIAARRTGPIERLGKWVKRHPGLAASLAGVVVALVAAGFFAQQAWQDRQERISSEQAARRELLDEKMQQAQNHVLQGDFPRAEETKKGNTPCITHNPETQQATAVATLMPHTRSPLSESLGLWGDTLVLGLEFDLVIETPS
jgi:serine/threonine-protein kinase